MATALFTHLDCLAHIVPDGAPERPARLRQALDALDTLDLTRMPAPLVTDAQIAACHDQAYIDEIAAHYPETGLVALDGDTYISPTSEPAIRRAAGGAIAAVDAVLDQEVETAFVATRPPGHHAEIATAMGFCVFGNVAIAVKHALDVRGLGRVAVVDFDVHHGNGTQALLADEPRALVISSHQMPLWPGTGAPEDRGPHETLVNIPLPPMSDGRTMRSAYEGIVFPALREFAPELLILSAGFDAHASDPLANLNWHDEDYRWLTRELCLLAQELCDGRVVSVLEGGYDLDALGRSVRVHVEELMKVKP